MQLAPVLVFIAVPLLEIGVLIKAGQWLGFWSVVGIIFATGLLGSFVIARQGFNAPFRIQEAMLRGEPPVGPMFDGALIWFAGFLLITPGLVADAVGLVLLIPPVRSGLARWAARTFFGVRDSAAGPRRDEARTRTPHPDAEMRRKAEPRSSEGPGPVIDGEFERLDERPLDPRAPRGNGSGRA